MDPTTADFNAWLAEEGAKIGATVPPQPGNLLAMYGTGYVPADTAYEPTTADILTRAQARDAGFPGFLRRMSDAIPESGRHLDPRGADEGLLAYWKRAADALSVHDMAKGGLNTAANWLDGSRGTGQTAQPGEGYGFAVTGLEPSDVLAPTGGVVSGAAVGAKALNKPSLTDSARARYLEWKHPDDFPAISGGEGQFNSAKYLAEKDRMTHDNPHSIRNAAEPIATDPDAAVINNYARNVYKTHNDVLEVIEQLQKAPASAERDAALAKYRQMRFRTASLLDELDPPEFSPANERGTPRDRFRLLSDQSRASVPGTVVNAQEEYGQRNDGTAKGKGFLGELQRPDGGVSTEISVGVNIGGKEMEVPLLVPTLTQQEIRFLLENDPASGDIPESIMRKAYDHAVGRVGNGLSPFAD